MSPSAALSTGKPMDSHPSYTDTPVSAPRTLSAVGPPLNALGSPYRVITSAMGPPSGALAAPPGINLVAPPSSQVGVLALAGLPSAPPTSQVGALALRDFPLLHPTPQVSALALAGLPGIPTQCLPGCSWSQARAWQVFNVYLPNSPSVSPGRAAQSTDNTPGPEAYGPEAAPVF